MDLHVDGGWPFLNTIVFADLFIQSLLKKHEAVENDFAVHKTRVQNVCAQGEEDIISKVSSEEFVTFSESAWFKYRNRNSDEITYRK